MPVVFYLVDTNVLLRLANRDDPQYSIVRNAIDALGRTAMKPAFTLQNLAEFWNVSTRPKERNGFGWTIELTNLNARRIEAGLTFLADSEAVYQEWRRVVVEHSISGVKVHDARLAAAMYVHNIANILTFNATDFGRFKGITAIDPASFIAPGVSSESVS